MARERQLQRLDRVHRKTRVVASHRTGLTVIALRALAVPFTALVLLMDRAALRRRAVIYRPFAKTGLGCLQGRQSPAPRRRRPLEPEDQAGRGACGSVTLLLATV